MAFPSSPTNGQQHTENNRTYQYNGSNAWQLVANNSLHASTHASGGSDAVSLAASQITSGTLDIARVPTGATSTTVCVGNDSRLSDSRTPTTHASTHATGGADAITPASISAAPAASPTFTGVVTVAAGAVGAPAITTTGDTNTGVYFPGADQVSVSTGGVQRIHVDSAGNVGIGGNATTAQTVRIAKSITGSTAPIAVLQTGVVQSDATVGATGIYNILSTAAASFTCGTYTHFLCAANALGANSAVTNQVGYSVSSTLTGATNNWGFRGNIGAGTGRYNLYMDGTAQNYLAGNLGIGSASIVPAAPLDIASDNIRIRTAKTPSSATDAGNAGTICWDANYVYVCVSSGSWKRAALAAW